MEIFMAATRAGADMYLSRAAAVEVAPAPRLTPTQNLIQTVHHEYLHYLGVTNHDVSIYPWTDRVIKDLGGWIRDY